MARGGHDQNLKIDSKSLMASGAVTKSKYALKKVVGSGELTAKDITVKAHAFTESAREAIEGNGGKCVLLSKVTHQPLAA